jgi:hypothetical protein
MSILGTSGQSRVSYNDSSIRYFEPVVDRFGRDREHLHRVDGPAIEYNHPLAYRNEWFLHSIPGWK